MKIRKLLVPLDRSAFAEHALPLAIAIAKHAGADVRLAHVLPRYTEDPRLNEVEGELEAVFRRDAEGYLGEKASEVAERTGTEITTALLAGDPAEALRQEAIDFKADLIIMSTHGHGPISRLWLGSVADDLMRQAPIPVLLDRPRADEKGSVSEPVLRRWLVPLDGSELSRGIIPAVTAVGKVFDAEVTCLRVIEPMYLGADDLTGVGIAPEGQALYDTMSEIQQTQQREAIEDLDTTVAEFARHGLTAHGVLRTEASPAPTILEIAEEVDAIALATHGRAGLSRWLLGSTADKVARGSPKPLLVFHPSTE